MTDPDVLAAGMIDLHTHVLPGVDDGCESVGDSLETIIAWADRGVTDIVCTPHCGPNVFPQNTPDRVMRMMVDLREEVARAEIAVRLHDGGEVRITAQTIDWFSFWGLPTIGEGNWILLDWWGKDWPAYVPQTLAYLVENGYQPLLAHPERMHLDDTTFERAVRETTETGALLQGNLNSLAGGEGRLARARSEHLLTSGQYFVLASDTHRPGQVPGRAEGLTAAARLVGSAMVSRLTVENPRRVIRLADRFA